MFDDFGGMYDDVCMPICSLVLVYLRTWMGNVLGKHQ
jgi:hypothetical protein